MINTYGSSLVVAGLTGLLLTNSLGAQSSSELGRVELAAVEYVRAKLPNGPLKLDPMQIPAGLAHPNPAKLGLRDSARTSALARALGAAVVPYSEVIVCSEALRKCEMKGTASLVRVSAPQITGEQASITITLITGPSWYETLELTLTRRGGQWAVLRERQLGIS